MADSNVGFIHEPGQKQLTLVDRTYVVSDYVFKAFEYAKSLIAQQRRSTMQTRAILLGFTNEPDSNAFALLWKVLVLYEGAYPKRFTELEQEYSYWHGNYNDGVVAQEKIEQANENARLVNKLKRSDYSILDDYGVDLTDQAKQGLLPPLIGRKQEVNHLALVLNRRSKRNALLLGPAGSGKTAIVEGLAQRIANGEVPSLAGKKLIEITPTKLADMLSHGLDLEVFARLIQELAHRQNVILYLDEIQNLRMLARQALLNMLKPVLARGEVQLIGSTTPMEADVFFDDDEALERRFEMISVPPLTRDQTDQVLNRASVPYENYYGLNFTRKARQVATDLAQKYIKFPLPDSALTILDTAGAMELAKKGHQAQSITDYEQRRHDLGQKLVKAKQKSLNEDQINQLTHQIGSLTKLIAQAKNDSIKHKYSVKLSVPQIVKATEAMTQQTITKETLQSFQKRREVGQASVLSLADRMEKHIIGQDEAVDKLAQAMIVAKAKLGPANTPIGAFFFAGLTGVGKTETAKQLAFSEYGSENALIRFNMADYADSSVLSSATTRFDQDLYRAVINRPRGVILLDEFEKAQPSVANNLLSIFADGTYHPQGVIKPVFDQTIFVLTSNIGSHQNKQHVGFDQSDDADSSENIKKAIHRYYSPEFLNRLDAICIFNELQEDDLKQITQLLLEKEQRQLANRGYNLKWSSEVVAWLVDHFADTKYGARPLARGIKKTILSQLAIPMVKGEVRKHSTLTFNVDQDQIKLVIH